jgi:outer membrane protein OmpA-like peptidoglycan-associated protein
MVSACTPHLDAPREFNVFFETDQASLTPEAQRLIHEIAGHAGELHPSKIVVAGRADGGTAHDATLADDRATAVMRALGGEGLAPSLLEKQPDAPQQGISGVAAHRVIVRFLP